MRKVVLLLASVLAWIGCAFGQQRTVTGVVTSAEDGTPMEQLTVQVKGTQTGDVTKQNGSYSVNVPGPEAILIFAYTGYETQEITVGDQKVINVVMQPTSEEIDEVMVVAFGKAKKSTFTGSAASVSSKELERKQVSNVVNALSGKVPGVVIGSDNNQPGTTASIQIRGLGSFNASSAPLYVVDGIPYEGDVAAVNPADVESTVLLKDAASAALYGARAANGVVMITTKSGANARSEGMANVNVTAKVGYNFRGVQDYDKINDPKQYMATYFEGLYNGFASSKELKGKSHNFIMRRAMRALGANTDGGLGYIPFTYDPGTALNPTLLFERGSDGHFTMIPEATLGTFLDKDGKRVKADDPNKMYWMQPDDYGKEIIRPDLRQEYTLSFSGRNNTANYFFSTGYLNDKGYTVGSDYTRFTTRLRGDYKPKTWLHMGGNFSYTGYKRNNLGSTTDVASSGNVFNFLDFIAPIYPLYVRDANKNIAYSPKSKKKIFDYGSKQFPEHSRPFFTQSNPFAENFYDYNEDVANIVGLRSYIDFIIPYGFKVTFNLGYDIDNTYSLATSNVFYGQNVNSGGTIYREFQRQATLNTQQLLTWEHSYGEHHIDVLLGHEYYDRDFQTMYGSRDNMYHYDSKELSQAIANQKVNSYRSLYRVEGYLGRAQYDWAEKYFVSLSYRRDGSSRFAKDNRWGNFYSAGASWLISNESFMEPTRSFLDLLKLKVSYGQQGNDNIDIDFPYTDLYSLSNANEKHALAFVRKGNPNITWETSSNLNAGVEFAFFKHRLTGSLEVYRRNVTDMLFQRPVPRSSGYSSYWDNIGAMSNTGVDLELRGVPYKDRNVVWSVALNGGLVRNKIEKLPDDWKVDPRGHIVGSKIYKEGESYYNLFIPKYIGVDDKGRSVWEKFDSKTGRRDTTTRYSEAARDSSRVLYKNIDPLVRGGFSTDVEFFGFDFNASFAYQIGGRTLDYTYQRLMHGGSDRGVALHADQLKAWTEEKKSDIPKMNYLDGDVNNNSSRFFTSRSYFSIDNITLGYTFKKEWVDKIGIGSLRVYAVADNIWIFSARKGFDPRFGSGVGYKAVRTISGGVNLTF